MKYLILICLLTALSCTNTSKSEYSNTYVERSLSFFNPGEESWLQGENEGHVYEKWIREPENLRAVHETLKQIGYQNLISEEDRYSSINRYGLFIARPMDELLDSLIITYGKDSIGSQYYREFWNRREEENNQEAVYQVLREISSELYEDITTAFNQALVNDTLYQLVQMKELTDSITPELAKKHFEYLKLIGMHQSAYNILFENYRYEHLKWDREELVQKLSTDSMKRCLTPWIEDNTK